MWDSGDAEVLLSERTLTFRSMASHHARQILKGHMPSHKAGSFQLGKSEKVDVALQRPNVNVKEAENQGEQARAATGQDQAPVIFTKHGTFVSRPNPLEQE